MGDGEGVARKDKPLGDLRRGQREGRSRLREESKMVSSQGAVSIQRGKKLADFYPLAASFPTDFTTPIPAGMPTVSPKGLLRFLCIRKSSAIMNMLRGVLGLGCSENLCPTVHTSYSLQFSLKTCCS